MSIALILVVTVLYMGVFFSELWNGNFGMSVVWLGYSIANVGFIASMAK